jgi:hypothetical protein
LAALVGLTLLGAIAFLLLLDVVYRQDDPVVPEFTSRLGVTAAASILVGTLAVALVAAVAVLLPRKQRPAAWSPGAACRTCGTWVEGLDGPCPSCGAPLAL